MYYLGFGNLKANIVLIAVLSVVLAVILIYEYWQKHIEKKQYKHLNSRDEDYKANE